MQYNRLGDSVNILSAKEQRKCDAVAVADGSQEDAVLGQVDDMACDVADSSRPV